MRLRHGVLVGLVLGLALALAAGCENGQTRAGAVEKPQEVHPALVGEEVPHVNVRTPEGNIVDLHTVTSQKPTVLVVYRGNWCVYCNRHLAALEKIEPELLEMGYQIVAISPDKPSELKESIEQHDLEYQLLSDSNVEAITELGLAYYVDQQTRRDLERYGVDLKAASGQPHYMLPVPAVFIVGRRGVIRFQHVDTDYKNRLDTDVILTAARATKGK